MLNLLLAAALLQAPAEAERRTEQFWEAARRGDAATVKALLDQGVDPNTKFRYGATALSCAADRGHLEVIRLLVEHGADVNVKDTFYGATPIVWAGSKGHLEVVKLLLERGADASPLLAGAAAQGKLELVRIILNRGGLSEAALSQALAAAQKTKRDDIAELLLKAGAKAPQADFAVDAATLESYSGHYQGPRGKRLRLAVKDGKLAATVEDEGTFTLGAVDKTNFRVLEIPGITATFEVSGGKAITLTLKEGPGAETYRKVDAP